MIHNPGKYNLSYCELCLLFKRGRIPTPRGARNTKQLINAPRGKHSEKPVEAARNIELMFPYHKRIELFAVYAIWLVHVGIRHPSNLKYLEESHENPANRHRANCCQPLDCRMALLAY